MKKIILRADGNSQIGLGHIYRLLALAEILKDDFDCSFAINKPDPFILEQIEKTCKSCIQLNNKVNYYLPDLNKPEKEIDFDLKEHLVGNEIVVTDGYLFGEKYQLAVKATGAKLVCIDDLAVNHFYADAIINHAPGIDPHLYKIEAGTILLTGLDYTMIRQPFFKPFGKVNILERNAFISLGGSDYFEYTKKLLKILLDEDFKSLHVLTSSSFSNALLNDLNELKSSFAKIHLHHNLNADELVNVIDGCSHAFVAASTVLIEAYSRGLKCFTGHYTENQKFIYNGFISQNLSIGLGSFEDLTKPIFSEKTGNQNNISYLTSPLSSNKILKTFKLFRNSELKIEDLNYKLREVTASDINLLFEWANDVEVRSSAINTGRISFEEHIVWFRKKINSTNCKIFILELDNVPVGQARFEFNDPDNAWVIDYSVSKKFRGLGLAKVLLTEAILSHNQFPVIGFVKENNKRSSAIFTSLGFINRGIHQIKNSTLTKYSKEAVL